MQIGERKEIRKLTFRALALRRSEFFLSNEVREANLYACNCTTKEFLIGSLLWKGFIGYIYRAQEPDKSRHWRIVEVDSTLKITSRHHKFCHNP